MSAPPESRLESMGGVLTESANLGAVKLTFALVRHASLTVRQFNSQYGSFARTLTERPAVRDLVRRFNVYATVDTSIPGAPPKVYDGIIDLYFDDDASAAKFLEDPSYLSATLGSELFNIPASALLHTAEMPAVIDDSESENSMTRRSQVRFSTLLVRNPAMSFAEFGEYHRSKHIPLFASTPAVKRNVRRYIVSHTMRDEFPGAHQRYDGVVDFWFDNIFSAMRLFIDPGYLRTVRPDEKRFLDLKACDFIISKQIPIN